MSGKILKTAVSFLLLSSATAFFSLVLNYFDKNIFLIFEFSYDTAYFFAYLLISFAFLAYSISLANILIGDWKMKTAVIALSSFAYFADFDFSFFNLATYLIIIAGFLIFDWQISQRLKEKAEFKSGRIFFSSQKILELFLILAVSFNFYSVFDPVVKDKNFTIPDSLVRPFLKGAIQAREKSGLVNQNLLEKQISELTVGQMILNQEELRGIDAKFQNQSGRPPAPSNSGFDLKKFSQSQLPNSAPELASEIYKQILNFPKMKEFLEQNAIEQFKKPFEEIIHTYKNVVAVIIALLLFFTLLPFRGPITLVNFIFFSLTIKALAKLKLIEFEEKTIEVKKLKID